MSDMITIVDPGYTWTPWFWSALAVSVIGLSALVCLGISFLTSTRTARNAWFKAFKIIGIIALSSIGVGPAASAIISGTLYNHQVDVARDAALNDVGYFNLDTDRYDSNLFTANRDGMYVKAVIVEIAPLTWQVFELDVPR